MIRLSSCPSSRWALALCWVMTWGLAFGPTAWASEQFADVQTAIQAGSQLERDDDWLQAVRLYKEALKEWPNDALLTRALRRSQFQYSIERRYTDSSFLESLASLSKPAALDHFDTVLAHIQAYYVDSINTTSIVAHGTESLWLALGNDRFRNENLFGASPEKIDELRRTLYERFWNKPVHYRDGARRLIGEVSDLCSTTVGLEPGAVVMEYVFGACNCLDDYSSVLTPRKKQDLFGNIQGEFVGIGIVMEGEAGHGMKLLQILPDSPASEAGLQANDFIVAIDGVDCRELSTDEAANLLTGRSGSEVRLAIRRGEQGRQLNARCVRREVKVKSIPVAKIIDSQNGIGYIQMTGFQQSTVAELDEALMDLHQQGMRSLVWDLRGNPGGLLESAVEVLDRFISDGIIVSTRGRVADQNSVRTAHSPGTWQMPLVLLIDGHSASASEIVAGAIRDHARGRIVGRTSFGKWSVQSLYDLPHATAVRITTAKFYSPKGTTWGKIGLAPDIEVDEPTEPRPIGNVDVASDPDVQEALRQLTNREFSQR